MRRLFGEIFFCGLWRHKNVLIGVLVRFLGMIV